MSPPVPQLSRATKCMVSAPQEVSGILINTTPPSMTDVNWTEAVGGNQRKSLVTCSGNPMDVGSDSLKRCVACGQGIGDRHLLHTTDGFWHVRCLRCSCCQVALGEIGTSCFSRAGMTLCREDYVRSVGRKILLRFDTNN